MRGEDVGLLDALGVDGLVGGDVGERPQAVAVLAARSNSSSAAASSISRWYISRTFWLSPRRKRTASSTSLPYSSSAISPVQGAEQRLIW